MGKHITTMLAAVAAACVLASCGSKGEDQETPTGSTPREATQSSSPGPETSVPSMKPVIAAPEIPAEMGEKKAAATAQNFVEQWLTFSPSDFSPKLDWFDRWQKFATDDFRQDMRVQADDMWSWTWNQGRKSCCASFEGKPAVEVLVGAETAAAKVSLRRYKLDLFATSGELEKGKGAEKVDETYIIEMQVGRDKYNVSNAYLVPANALLPEVK